MTMHTPLPALPRAEMLGTAAPATLESTAARYARGDAEAGERELALLTERAILGWRLEEAAFWQRVKFRARMLRAQMRGRSHPLRGGTALPRGG